MVARCAAALVILSALWTSAALADETNDAIKCLAVSLKASNSSNPDDESIGMLSTMYWLGKLDGVTPKVDLEKEMQSGAFDMKPEDEKVEEARCASSLRERGPLLTHLGEEQSQRQNSN
jgi:hypothetical protein